MVIGLIVAAELTVVKDARPIRERIAEIRPMLLIMLLGAATFFAIRTFALGGDPVGTFTAEALDGLSIGGRTLTMLAVVPHWYRLLLWPAHLQGDYAPREIEAATTWGLGQTQDSYGMGAVHTVEDAPRAHRVDPPRGQTGWVAASSQTPRPGARGSLLRRLPPHPRRA